MKKFYGLLFFALLSITAFGQRPLVKIDSIQFKPLDSLLAGKTITPRNGDTVRVRGCVMSDPRFSALRSTHKIFYLQDTTAGSWKGISVQCRNVDTTATNLFNNIQVGNYVEVTGVVQEFVQNAAINPNTGETQLNLIPVPTTALGIVQKPMPKPVMIDQFMKFVPDSLNPNVMLEKAQYVTGEPYEGMYVEFPRVTIVNVSTFSGGNRVNWNLRDSLGNEIVVRDAYAFFRAPYLSSTANTPPNPNASVFVQAGKKFAYVRGIITETNQSISGVQAVRYQLVPVDTTDLGPVLAVPPYIDSLTNTPVVPSSTQAVTIAAKITDDGSVAGATLYYAVGASNLTYTAVTMTSGANNRYTASIPAQANGSFVKFFIRAVDNEGNKYDSNDSLNCTSMYKVIDGGIKRIADIQQTPLNDGSSIYNGKTLTGMAIRCVIHASAQSNDFNTITVQQGNGPWSGIIAQAGLNNDLDTRFRGDSIIITAAKVVETAGVTILQDVYATYISSGNLLAPVVPVVFDSVRANRLAYCEPFESMIVKLDTVYAINLNPNAPNNFGRFVVNPDSTKITGVRIEDASQDIPSNFNTDSITLKQKFNWIRGVLGYNLSNWVISPRNRSDIQGYNTSGTFVSVQNIPSVDLVVYPNPANTSISARFENKAENTVLEIMDMSGRVLFSKSIREKGILNEEVEINQFQSGLYFLLIRSGQGTQSRRFVIAH